MSNIMVSFKLIEVSLRKKKLEKGEGGSKLWTPHWLRPCTRIVLK